MRYPSLKPGQGDADRELLDDENGSALGEEDGGGQPQPLD